jgi:tetratricopeptide (TPR) repeat protein
MALRDDLIERVEAGDVIWIVGTGVSVGATARDPLASWAGLLHSGLDRARELGRLADKAAQQLHEHVDSDDLDLLLGAAEIVSTKLGAPKDGEWSRWLRDTVGQLTVQQPVVLEALCALGGVLATTNYDDLLVDVSGLPPVTWRDGAEVERALRGDAHGVVHLHGHWAKPESVILGIRDYARVLGDAHAQAMQQAIRSSRTLVFVGCGYGLHDPNFGALLRWSEQVFAGSEYRHYRLARTEDVTAARAQHPGEQRIAVLDYGPHFEDLGPFLRGLLPASGRAPTPLVVKASALAPTPGPALLPPAPQCFGREQETALLLDALGKREPVTVLGPPGIGKSTVTLVGLNDARVAAAYGARRFFVRCESVRSRADLAAAIATAIGCQVGPHVEAAIVADLRTAPAALALDNLETPWEADVLRVEELLEQLAVIPGLALAASLRGLSRPNGVAWRTVEPKTLGPDDARKAFLAIAGEAFAKDPYLDELLRALDGVPLAVTLMAGAAQGEPDLLGTWRRWQAERTAMLQRGSADARLLSIEVSYEISLRGPRMTEKARRLLGVLSLFPAGIAREDIDAVFRKGRGPANVLRQVGLAFDEGARTRLLAPLREYVARAHAPSKRDREPAVSHYLGLAERLGNRAGAAGGAEAIAVLTPESGNIERAISIALCDDRLTPACTAATAFAEFARFAAVGSPVPVLEAAEAARRVGAYVFAANCLLAAGQLSLARSDRDAARSHLEAALAVYERAGKHLGRANCLNCLGDIALLCSEDEVARARFEEALALYRREGDRLGEANCIQSLGTLSVQRSDPETARAFFEEALALFHAVEDALGEANCIHGLGEIALRVTDLEAARARFEEALPLYQRIGHTHGEANSIRGLGQVALERSDHHLARRHFEEAHAIYRRVGDALGEANSIHCFGEVAFARGDYEEAWSRFEQALPLYQRLREIGGEANCIHSLGEIEFARARHEAARVRFEQALPLQTQVGSLLGQGNSIRGLAQIDFERGNLDLARTRFEQALALYERTQEPLSIGWTHQWLSRTATSPVEREAHADRAAAAWRTIGRDDLIAKLRAEVGEAPSR